MTTKRLVEIVAADLAVLRAKLEVAKANWSRFPAGSRKGGQFAPKGGGGGGGFSGLASFLNASFPGEGALFKPKQKPAGAQPHPKKGEKGETVTVDYPSKASDRSTWRDPKATATWTPGSDAPPLLNGVALKPWKAPASPEGWANVAGQNPKLDERMPFVPTPGKSVGAGVVVMEPDGRVWLTKPTNEFGGYKHTFPKGTAEPGLSLQANAIKEAWEETGLKVEIVGVMGDFERTTSKARFYLARRVGGTPSDMGWETQAVRLAPLKNAMQLLNMAHDRGIIENVKGVRVAKSAGWTKQPRWPKGSALGGQWKSYDSEGLPLPPKLGSSTNPTYAKAAQAAYEAAKAGDTGLAAKVAAKYAGADAAFNVAGGKGVTYHVKEGAKAYLYANDLIGAVGASAVASAKQAVADGPAKLSSMTKFAAKPGGSNPGAMYTDAEGQTVLVKGNKQLADGKVTQAVSDNRAKNEVLASELMKAAGVGAPDMKLVDLEGEHGGGLGVASKWVSGGKKFDPSDPAHIAAAQQDFAVHAWLANYDVVGMSFDNLSMVNGKAVNIDPGGALLFRAQGMPKDSFGKDAGEFASMRDPKINATAAKVYGSMTATQLANSAQKLKQVTDDQIKALVEAHGPGGEQAKKDLAVTLISRRDSILAKVGIKPPGQDDDGDTLLTTLDGLLGNPPAAAAPAPAPQTAAPPGAPPASPPLNAPAKMKTFSFVGGGSDKYWSVGTTGNLMVTHYGKTGSAGQVSVKAFATQQEAEDAAFSLASQKTGKGYLYSGQTTTEEKVKLAVAAQQPQAPAPAPAPPPAAAPAGRAPAPAPAGPAPGQFPAPPIAIAAQGLGSKIGAMGKLIEAKAQEGVAPKVVAGKNTTILLAGSMVTVGNPPKTAHGKALLDYAQQAAAHVQAQQAKADAQKLQQAQDAMAAVQQAPGVVNPPKPGQQAAGGMPAMPDFDKAKIATTNSNAQSHNAKVDKIASLAAAGDVKGLLAMGFGTNTYGQKQAKLANNALAAMGVTATVGAGQKPNAHPAINGSLSPDKASAVLANAGKPAAASTTAPATPGKVANVPANLLPKATDFVGANGGKGLSSVAWVNQQNQELQAKMEALAKAGELAALQSMTFELKDKATGNSTGKVAGMSEHPSKNIQIYWNDAVALLQDVQAGPPRPLKVVDTTAVKSAADAASHFPGKPFGTTVAKVKANERFGFWVALGSVTNPGAIAPKQTMPVAYDDIQKSYAEFAAMKPKARKFINNIQASGAFNDAFRDGKTTYGNDNLKDLAKAALGASKESPEGTVIHRWQNMPPSMLAQIDAAEPGLVFQSTGPMCCSYSPTATKNFGTHLLNIRYAKGAKALHSYGSTKFDSEKEISTLPGARFVLLGKKKGKDGRYELDLLMLPPEEGAFD